LKDSYKSHHEAFFRENCASKVYELFIKKSGPTWLTMQVPWQNFDPGGRVRTIKPDVAAVCFWRADLNHRDIKQERRELVRERQLCCFVHKRK
jgi:hypothetical protein